MIQYDENVIQESAKLLYAQAASVVRTWRWICGFLGVPAGIVLYAITPNPDGAFGIMAAAIGACAGVALGDVISRPKALIFRLQAQQALCQVQIEKNTRHSVDAADNAARELQLRMMAQR